jgi:hypothetical protein
MCASPQLALEHDIDWQAVEAFATQDMIQCLHAGEFFISTISMRDQCHHTCRVLRIEHRPAVSYLLVAKIFAVSKSTVSWHCKQ